MTRRLLSVLLVLVLGCGGADPGAPDGPSHWPPASELPREARDPKLDRALAEAFGRIRQREFDPARAILEPLVRTDPAPARAVFYLGLTYLQEKRYEAAREVFEGLRARGPSFEDYYLVEQHLGLCLYRLGELAGAREAFERALTGLPTLLEAEFGLGLVALERGELEAAEARFTKCLAATSDKPHFVAKVKTRLADVRLRQGRLEEARSSLSEALEAWPGQYNAYYKLYQIETRLGHPTEAADALRRFEAWQARQRKGT